MAWVKDPHSGGIKVKDSMKKGVEDRILKHAEENYKGNYDRIEVKFRGQFCYIDAYKTPVVPEDFPPPGFPESREEYIERVSSFPLHLCRLRYFGNEDEWSFAFFSYGNEKYEPCIFKNGSFYGTLEEAFDASALYLFD